MRNISQSRYRDAWHCQHNGPHDSVRINSARQSIGENPRGELRITKRGCSFDDGTLENCKSAKYCKYEVTVSGKPKLSLNPILTMFEKVKFEFWTPVKSDTF